MSKFFKISFCLILNLILSFAFCGCESEKNESKVLLGAPFLSEGDWERYDANIGETVSITFNKNGEYFYCCSCGEPIGDSDLYDKYEYDSTYKTIKLTGPDDVKMGINVVYYDEYYLVLKFPDDGVKVFKNQNSAIDEFTNEADVDLKNKSVAYLCVLGYEEGKVTLAPCSYDGDAKESFKNNIVEAPLAKNADFRSLNITIRNGKESKRDDFMLEDSDKTLFGEDYRTGYVVFNDKGEVSHITFYGTLEIME